MEKVYLVCEGDEYLSNDSLMGYRAGYCCWDNDADGG